MCKHSWPEPPFANARVTLMLAGQAVASFIAISAMGVAAVGLRTANSILQTAAAAGRLGPRLAPGSAAGGPWWLPSGSQALLNLISSGLSRE